MFLVGLTGGIACGKSTISKMLTELDVQIIDSDYLARKVVEPGSKAWRKIRKVFGDSVLEDDGQLNRKKLGEVIFGNEEKRAQLNSITHPEIAKEIFLQILYYFVRGHQFVIIDSPLLYEVNTWIRLVHKVIVASCEEDSQLQRLMSRDNFSKDQALARINSQMSMQEKRSRADYIIYNDGSIDETREQVKRIYDELRSLNTHWFIRFALLVLIGLFVFLSWLLIRFVLSIF